MREYAEYLYSNVCRRVMLTEGKLRFESGPIGDGAEDGLAVT